MDIESPISKSQSMSSLTETRARHAVESDVETPRTSSIRPLHRRWLRGIASVPTLLRRLRRDISLLLLIGFALLVDVILAWPAGHVGVDLAMRLVVLRRHDHSPRPIERCIARAIESTPSMVGVWDSPQAMKERCEEA